MISEPARADDFDAITRLLERAGLPTGGLRDQFPAAYVVVRGAAEVVAVAAMERYGHFGLLRSVAVALHHRRAGLGRELIEELLDEAERQSVKGVYLLTTTAPDYFRRLGFVDAVRADAPESVRRAPEFKSICPGSATCLVRLIGS